jgi:hypothetical protein
MMNINSNSSGVATVTVHMQHNGISLKQIDWQLVTLTEAVLQLKEICKRGQISVTLIQNRQPFHRVRFDF